MNLRFHPAVLDDFDSFYRGCFFDTIDDYTLRGLVRAEWDTFGRNSAALSMVVEDNERRKGDQVVGYAQTVFVTDAFVDVSNGAPPHVNQHAIGPLPDGSWPLLEIDEVRVAQQGVGLNALTTRYHWREGELSEEERWKVRSFVDQAYSLFWRGYNLKRTLFASYGDGACQSLIRAGYRLITDYQWYFDETGIAPTARNHPYLLGFDRDDAVGAEGLPVSRPFYYTPPRFGFPPHEQEVLWLAILGLPDDRMPEILCVSMSTIKARWKRLFERVADVDRDLLPANSGQGRGPEKRGELLRYLRDHLEEIRPVSGPKVRIR